MSYPYLAYFNDEPVGIVPLSGRFSEDRNDKIGGTILVTKTMGFDTRLSYLMYLPGYSLEENPLKEYDTDIVFLALKNKIGYHTMQVNFAHHQGGTTSEAIVKMYEDAKDWNDIMFYVQPNMEEACWFPARDELWYCSDWEG